jgi:hypothetical protein
MAGGIYSKPPTQEGQETNLDRFSNIARLTKDNTVANEAVILFLVMHIYCIIGL